MKKTISLLLAVVMCFLAVSVLSACKEEHVHAFADTWTSDGTHHWYVCDGCDETSDKAEHTWDAGEVVTAATVDSNGTKRFSCTVCGYVEEEQYSVKTTVTAEEWVAAFDDANFENVTMTMDVYVKEVGDWFSIMMLDGTSMYEKMTAEDASSIETYQYLRDGKYYLSAFNGTEWEEVGGYDEQEIIDTFGITIHQNFLMTVNKGAMITDQYQKFQYNEQLGVYEAENITVSSRVYVDGDGWKTVSSTAALMRVCFADGRVVKIETFGSTPADDEHSVVTWSDYGTTKVTPQPYGTLTDEELFDTIQAAAQGAAAYDGTSTLSMTVIESEGKLEGDLMLPNAQETFHAVVSMNKGAQKGFWQMDMDGTVVSEQKLFESGGKLYLMRDGTYIRHSLLTAYSFLSQNDEVVALVAMLYDATSMASIEESFEALFAEALANERLKGHDMSDATADVFFSNEDGYLKLTIKITAQAKKIWVVESVEESSTWVDMCSLERVEYEYSYYVKDGRLEKFKVISMQSQLPLSLAGYETVSEGKWEKVESLLTIAYTFDQSTYDSIVVQLPDEAQILYSSEVYRIEYVIRDRIYEGKYVSSGVDFELLAELICQGPDSGGYIVNEWYMDEACTILYDPATITEEEFCALERLYAKDVIEGTCEEGKAHVQKPSVYEINPLTLTKEYPTIAPVIEQLVIFYRHNGMLLIPGFSVDITGSAETDTLVCTLEAWQELYVNGFQIPVTFDETGSATVNLPLESGQTYYVEIFSRFNVIEGLTGVYLINGRVWDGILVAPWTALSPA